MRSSDSSRGKWRRLGFCAALCFVFATVAFANNDRELKAQAAALLVKSHDLSNLESAGSPPFELIASVQYTEDGKSGPGRVEIDWLAPGHFRTIVSAPGYSYTQVVQDGKQYLSRTDDHVPLLSYELLQTLSTALTPPSFAAGKIKRVITSPAVDNKALTCPERKTNDGSLTLCLDDDGDVVSVERQPPADQFALGATYQLSSFAAFGLHRFPLNMKFQGGDGNEINIAVVRITPIENASVIHFDVPTGSAQQAWCAEPKQSDSSPTNFLNVMSLRQLGFRVPAMTVLYVEVAAGGKPRGMMLIYSSQPIEEPDLEKWVFEMQFPVIRCGDDAIEYQLEIAIKAPQLPTF